MEGCVPSMRQDKHIHTPFCPHGSTDALEGYIEKAIASGFEEICFTEHAPLPDAFIDPTPLKDSGMNFTLLEAYFTSIAKVKHQYAKDISILCGLEVDFIEGFEQQTTHFLNQYGEHLDDAIMSVHFLRDQNHYVCIDYSPEVFMAFAAQLGSITRVYEHYYNTVEKSIIADLGPYKPKRIGHPTLVHKFQLAHKENINDTAMIQQVLRTMQAYNYELDVNSAGLVKEFCLEPYPPYPMIKYAKSLGIPLVFGSDAHTIKGLHQQYDAIKELL